VKDPEYRTALRNVGIIKSVHVQMVMEVCKHVCVFMEKRNM
jgi:hypothetical protein